MSRFLLSLFFMLVTSCQEDSEKIELRAISSVALIAQLPSPVIDGLAKQPQADGALSRNIPDYFHVRFQLDIAFNAVYAVYHEDEEALKKVAQSIQYSFDHQTAAGDFEFVLPANLQHLGNPSAADLASGVAFFGSSLGFTLSLLEQSDWYNDLTGTQTGKQIIQNLEPEIQLLLNWLKQQVNVLKQVDADATNRLLWNARCFLGLGKYLNDESAIAVGYDFLTRALKNQHATGYFSELNGFDSSYNGVSLLLAINVFTMPLTNDVKEKLSKAILAAAQWQLGRILPTGEINTNGNTRVYVGGETFLGEEKTIAWIDTLLALRWLQILNPEGNYLNKANQIQAFYE